jgi:hypothetical protein
MVGFLGDDCLIMMIVHGMLICRVRCVVRFGLPTECSLLHHAPEFTQ